METSKRILRGVSAALNLGICITLSYLFGAESDGQRKNIFDTSAAPGIFIWIPIIVCGIKFLFQLGLALKAEEMFGATLASLALGVVSLAGLAIVSGFVFQTPEDEMTEGIRTTTWVVIGLILADRLLNSLASVKHYDAREIFKPLMEELKTEGLAVLALNVLLVGGAIASLFLVMVDNNKDDHERIPFDEEKHHKGFGDSSTLWYITFSILCVHLLLLLIEGVGFTKNSLFQCISFNLCLPFRIIAVSLSTLVIGIELGVLWQKSNDGYHGYQPKALMIGVLALILCDSSGNWLIVKADKKVD